MPSADATSPRQRAERGLALGLPAFMNAWPPGLLPTHLHATRTGLRLHYRAPDGRHLAVALHLNGASIDHTVVHSTFAPEAVARLVAALRARTSASEDAVRDDVRRAAALMQAVELTLGGHRPSADALAQLASDLDAGDEGGFTQTARGVALLVAISAEDFAHADALATRSTDPSAYIVRMARILWDMWSGRGVRATEDATELASARMSESETSVLGRVLTELGRRDLAFTLLGRAASVSPSERLALAKLAMATGNDAEGVTALAAYFRDARARPSLDERREAITLLTCSDDPRVDEVLALARKAGLEGTLVDVVAADRALFVRDTDRARSLLAARDDHDARIRLAIADALDGHLERAHDALTGLLERDPRSQAITLWLAHVALRRGDATGAERMLGRFDDTVVADHPVAKLLSAKVRYADPLCAIDDATAYIHRAIVRAILERAIDFSGLSTARELELIDEALDRLGGNFGNEPTIIDAASRSFRRGTGVESPRDTVATLQHAIAHRRPDDVKGSLRAYAAAFPEVPFGDTYAAEIDLWQGHYASAFASFDASWHATRTRWSYVGSGAALFMLGRTEDALARFAEGEAHFSGLLPIEATHCYRAEALERLGQLDEARRMLEATLRVRPSRVGAFIALARVTLAQGDVVAAQAAYAEAKRQCPALVWHAERCAAVDAPHTRAALFAVLEACTTMMRGNRSSYLVTFVDDEGELRVVPVNDAFVPRLAASARAALASQCFG